MASQKQEEITHDFPGFFKVYKDGRVERYWEMDFVPPGLDQETGVESKDVEICSTTGVKARIFLPKISDSTKKLPLLVHYHGGGFCIGSPFATAFKIFLSTLAAQANVITMSVDYRRPPEHPLPTAYDDSWAGLQWVAKHSNAGGSEPWINNHADLGQVILAGESAGANIAHYVAVLAGATGCEGVTIKRLLIVHPYFGTQGPDALYQYMYPNSSGGDDEPKLNPGVDPNLTKLQCDKVLVCVAEKDMLKGGAMRYYETLRSCGWGGQVDLYETEGEDHCFHMFNPKSPNIGPLMNRIFDFIKIN